MATGASYLDRPRVSSCVDVTTPSSRRTLSTTGPRTSRREIARRSRGGRAEIARRWLEDRGRDRGIIRTWQARTTSHVESRLFEKAQHAMAVVESPGSYKVRAARDPRHPEHAPRAGFACAGLVTSGAPRERSALVRPRVARRLISENLREYLADAAEIHRDTRCSPTHRNQNHSRQRHHNNITNALKCQDSVSL